MMTLKKGFKAITSGRAVVQNEICLPPKSTSDSNTAMRRKIKFAQKSGGVLRSWMERGKIWNMREEQKWTLNTVDRVMSG